jgi:hypothetical protein
MVVEMGWKSGFEAKRLCLRQQGRKKARKVARKNLTFFRLPKFFSFSGGENQFGASEAASSPRFYKVRLNELRVFGGVVAEKWGFPGVFFSTYAFF